jgi:hypothetical protein
VLDEILTVPASIAAHCVRQWQKLYPPPVGESNYRGGGQQQHPDAEKEPGEIYEVRIN